jgi:hypothetical protein
LLSKEIREITSRKGVSEGIADKSVGACHMLLIHRLKCSKDANLCFLSRISKKTFGFTNLGSKRAVSSLNFRQESLADIVNI